MKVFKLGIFIFLISILMFGCSKKQEQVSTLSGLDVEGENKDTVTQTITSPEIEPAPAAQLPLEQPEEIEAKGLNKTEAAPVAATMPADVREKNRQIQTALKNAGLYLGEIDGKIGPLTRKAIEEFQKMKGLKVDGKVGPITWRELSKSLAQTETKKTR